MRRLLERKGYAQLSALRADGRLLTSQIATDVEGIFRLAGSAKRIKELQVAFDTPPRWGKGLDWTGYTVHDAANILRRYFNQLPEPIIPLQHYDDFRQPLRGHQAEAVGHIVGQAPSVGGFDPDAAVRVYQHLIKELPSLNRQLLLYILDLLAVFAAKSDINKMTTSNLASIFQPGILSHPEHDMSPQDYRLSQDVLIFLIDNQDHFLIGMEGTAVDEGTAKHVQSGPSTPARTPTTPGRKSTGLGRSASAASSAAAESVRKFGGVRRNVSTSSRKSRHSGAVPSPVTPSFGTPVGSGVSRSNTLPSKRSPVVRSSVFNKDRTPEPSTPRADEGRPTTVLQAAQNTHTAPPQSQQPDSVAHPTITSETLDVVQHLPEERLQPPDTIELPRPTPTEVPGAYPLPSPDVFPPSSEELTPTGPYPASGAQALAPPTSQRYGQPSPQLTPTREKSEFMEGPVDTPSQAGLTPAVRTFTQILSKVSPSSDEKRDGRKPNKLQKRPRQVSSNNPSAHNSTHSLSEASTGLEGQPAPMPPPSIPQQQHGDSKDVPQALNIDAVSSRHSGTTLKPSMSPSASFRSHSTATEYSEAEHNDEPPREEKRSFWKKGHKRGESKATPTASQTDLSGSVAGADRSMSSFGSSSGRGRRSLQYDSNQQNDTAGLYGSPDSKEQEKRSAFGWFRSREREAKKQRAKSPPGSSPDLNNSLNTSLNNSQHLGPPHTNEGSAMMGQSMDIPRTVHEDKPMTAPDETRKENVEVSASGPVSTPTPPQNTTTLKPADSNTEPPTARSNSRSMLDV